MNLAAIPRELREIPIALIDEPVLPSRASMDDAKMDELVASIRTVGLLQPIAVARVADRYEVIAGHRRRIASARAGLVVMPCVVYPSKEAGLEAIKFAENRHREDLNPAEEAVWFAELLERYCDGDTDRLAALLGERREYVEGKIALLTGDPEIFRALDAGRIGVGVAQQLNRCTDELHRRMLLDLATKTEATVGTVSGWISEWKTLHAPATRNCPPAPSSAAPAPLPLDDYFVCRLCRGRNNPQNMRPVQIHDYCVEAILKPALDVYHQRGAYVPMPRTYDEAAALIDQLTDRFPQLLDADPRRV